MLVQTYEDVVRRDRPNYWWRVQRNADTTVPNTGLLTNSGLARGAATSGPTMGIPGARTGGSTWLAGDGTTSTNSGEGWVPDPTSSLTLPTSDFVTYELWVYPHTTFTSARNYGLLYRDSATTSTVYYGLATADYAVKWRGDADATVTSDEKLRPDQWNHVVGIAGYANSTRAEVWVNGVPKIGTFSFGADVTIWGNTTDYRLRLGRGRSTSTYSPPCALAEPAIYPYALSPTQIVEHYQLGLGIRMRQSVRGALGFPFPQTVTPGGLTSIGDVTNRRIALVSDRPR